MTHLRELHEESFLGAVRDCALRLGWTPYHTRRSKGSDPGFPDLVLVRERIIYAELKINRGRTTPAQDEWLRRLEAAGAETYVWRPLHWDSIVMTLRRKEPRP